MSISQTYRLHFISVLFTGLLIFPEIMMAQTAADHSPASLFEEANSLYDAGNYPVAIEKYSDIIKQGYASGETFYNLANASFRNGSVGQAVVNYRRAWFLNPRDADVLANMNLALQRTGAIVPNSSVIDRGLKELSSREWSRIAQSSYWAAIGLTVLALVLPAIRQVSKTLAIIAWLIALAGSVGWFNWYLWKKKPEVVVIADKQTALYEPRASSTKFFTVPEGSILHLEDEFDAWVKISTGGNSGWLEKSSVERVYPWINQVND
jgi:tetratricopeptide (TPR) repeat protein